jgi:RNA recognition motif-containing protein
MSARLFVGNLSFDITEADLRELFTPVGPLSYVFLPVDRETGKKRGFAFVEFADEAKAAEALQRFNNQQFKGRALALSEARARESRPPSAGVTRTPFSRVPESFDHGSGLGDSGNRRSRRSRDDAKRHAKPGSRNARFEPGVKKGPKRERIGGRVFGLDDDDVAEIEEVYEDEPE